MITEHVERRASVENPSTSLANPDEWLVDWFGGGDTASSIKVNPEKALSWSAISQGIRLLSGVIASLPFKVFERREQGRRPATGHHLYPTIHDEANPEQTAFEFWEMEVAHMLLFGTGYAEKVRDGGSRVRELWPINPDRVRPVRKGPEDELWYRITLPKREQKQRGRDTVDLPADKVLRIPGFATDGLVGLSMVQKHREAIGLGVATEKFAAKFFGQGATPTGILEYPGELNDEKYKRIKGSAENVYQGLGNSHRLMLLEEGMKWKQVSADPEKSQLIGGREFQLGEAARVLNLPPHLVGDLRRSTFNNIESQDLQFLKYHLNPWLRRIQNRVNVELFPASERDRFFAEHVTNELMRANAQSRGEFYQARFQTASITPNDIRKLENENPVEGGDEPFVPMNMVPLSQALEMSPEDRAMLLSAGGEEAEKRDGLPKVTQGPTEDELEDYSSQQQRIVESMLPVMLDAADRMVRGEVRNITAKLDLLEKKATKAFGEFLNTYYSEEHPEFAARVMSPPFEGLANQMAGEASDLVGATTLPATIRRFVEDYTDSFVKRYAASSRNQLQGLVDTDNPKEQVERRLSEWEEGTQDGRPRAERWADREVHRLSNATAKVVWAGAGILALRWRERGESCPYCKSLDGAVVGMREPFIREGEEFNAEDADRPLTVSSNIGHPPAHRGCWTPDHDIFTLDGWKNITEVDQGDRLWTMNPETHLMETDVVQGVWTKRWDDRVAHINTRTIDLKLTPDHKMAIVTDWRHKYSDDKSLERREVQNLKYGDAIPRVPEWGGPEPDTVAVAGRQWPAREAMEFVGWYLSEGTICEHHTPGLWQAGIRQHDDAARSRIEAICDQLFDKVWKGKHTTYIPLREGDPMIEWLSDLGHSGDRYIPRELLQYGPETLRPMFDALIAGDGSVTEASWHGRPEWNFRPSLTFGTSSVRLASDMTELALKVGLRPTVGPRSKEPRTVEHWNGTYTAKKVQQTMSFGRNRWSTFKHEQLSYEPYSGAVVGLSMENNPVVLVRRGRKTCWVGNCDCVVVPG